MVQLDVLRELIKIIRLKSDRFGMEIFFTVSTASKTTLNKLKSDLLEVLNLDINWG